MIAGIGIDTVEIERFEHWHTFSSAQLQRLFSIAEIGYCLEVELLSAARFAVRFAAREAFFKALQEAYPESKISFLSICRHISVTHTNRNLPQLNINWHQLTTKYTEIQPLTSHLSLSHSRSIATAVALLEHKTANKNSA